MKAAIATDDNEVSQHFGRCRYFIIADNNDIKKFEPIQNSDVSASAGAGPEAARLINEKGAKAVLTGKVGPNAQSALDGYGIKVVEDVSGTVKVSLADYAAE